MDKQQQETLNAQYQGLLHAIQSGIAMNLSLDYPTIPAEHLRAMKHIRVGVDHALVMCGHIVDMLVEKGLLNSDDVLRHYIEAMKHEVKIREQELSVRLGKTVKLL